MNQVISKYNMDQVISKYNLDVKKSFSSRLNIDYLCKLLRLFHLRPKKKFFRNTEIFFVLKATYIILFSYPRTSIISTCLKSLFYVDLLITILINDVFRSVHRILARGGGKFS